MLIPELQKGDKAGLYWTKVKPESGKEWRLKYAVLEDWSKNGYYIAYTVQGNEPIKAWKGKIASQIDNNPKSATFGQYLEGGSEQLVIDFWHPANKKHNRF